MEKEWIDLLTLQTRLKDGLESIFPDRLWVRAELASVSVKSNGHCYLELSQSGPSGTVAKVRAVIWRSVYTPLQHYFRQTTGADLQEGMSIMARVAVNYSELYGLTLTIDELEPEYTLGKKEQQRQQTIARLEAEGMFERQKSLDLPLLPYKLAVISARDAAGYGDFCRHLLENEFGFKFCIDLFEATMQGPTAPGSIVEALEDIETSADHYDAVLVMRGGGSNLDLDCFDDYGMALSIAQFPIPVYTAIGHDRDYHIADMVAFRSVKTPTALADEFLDCYMSEDERIISYISRLRLAFSAKLSRMESAVDLVYARIKSADPRTILSRGFTLVTDSAGVVLKSLDGLSSGDKISVMFNDGAVMASVEEIMRKCDE